jgi:hypothetical protein
MAGTCEHGNDRAYKMQGIFREDIPLCFINSIIKASIFLYDKQQRQCTYNITLRHVCATTVAVVKQWVLHNQCVCVYVYS